MKKIGKWKYAWFVWPVIVFGIAVYLSRQESPMCDQLKPYYWRKINGKILKRSDCNVGGRRVGCIDLVDTHGNAYHFNYAHEFKVYRLIEKGDSVSKPTGTSSFEFYRHGALIGTMNWDCSPPTSN